MDEKPAQRIWRTLLTRGRGRTSPETPLVALVTELFRLVRFGLVGGAATVAHQGTAVLLVEAFDLNPVLASTLGVGVSAWISYFGHRSFSFGVAHDDKRYLPRFLVASAAAFLLNIAVMWAVSEWLVLPYWIGLAILLFAIPLTSYGINRWWVFGAGLSPGA